MRILAVEPYFGGSHRAFLEGWAARSRHDFELLTLPAHHWKWRMRLGAVTLGQTLHERGLHDATFDAVWCSSMLDVGLWRGVAPASIAALPHVVYFHENQFAYPDAPGQSPDVRDLHFGLTNLTSAWSALRSGARPWQPGDAPRLWWNSAYNRDTFLGGAGDLLQKAPDGKRDAMADWLPAIASASAVQPQGVELLGGPRRAQLSRPLHLAWAARWEHDKQPEVFFRAMGTLVERGVDVRLSVMGERFQLISAVFEEARKRFASRIVRWGYLVSRADYAEALRSADVFVSTAAHEFFGIAAVEAASAGCTVVLPRRLAYPEVFGPSAVFYEDEKDLVETLASLEHPRFAGLHVRKYGWKTRAGALDDALDAVID